MRILHLTDLHFTSEIGKLTKQDKLISNFKKDLKLNVDNIDFVIFSGDLVLNGSKSDDFNKAYKEFIESILEILKINKKNFFICPGNHDVDRNEVSKSIIKYIDEELKSNEDVNIFFNTSKTDLVTSHLPLKNYNN